MKILFWPCMSDDFLEFYSWESFFRTDLFREGFNYRIISVSKKLVKIFEMFD